MRPEQTAAILLAIVSRLTPGAMRELSEAHQVCAHASLQHGIGAQIAAHEGLVAACCSGARQIIQSDHDLIAAVVEEARR